MRSKGRTDANQAAIIYDLRKVGATVLCLSSVGNGCPDLLIGFKGNNFLIEIKDPDKMPSQRKLTPDQNEFHESWRGQVVVAESSLEALRIIGAM